MPLWLLNYGNLFLQIIYEVYIKRPIFKCENVMGLKNNYMFNQWIWVSTGGQEKTLFKCSLPTAK